MKETIIEYFERNYRRLLRLAVMTTKDVTAGEDVLHDVAVALLKRQDELSDLQHPNAYIAQAIFRSSLNYIRKNSRSAPADPNAFEEVCYHPKSEIAYDYAEWVMSIETHLQKYEPRIRKAFIAHYLDDVPIDTLAKALGMTSNALTCRFMRIRRALAKEAPTMFRHLEILSLM